MSKVFRILRELYPTRTEFSPEEVAFALKAIAAANADAKRSRIPRTDIRVGQVFYRRGVKLKCIRREGVSLPSDACAGCYFKMGNRSCSGLRCSSWDRSDKNNVWFVEVLEEEEK